MKPIVVETQIEIAAPPKSVWPYLVDWERLDRWMTEGSHFTITSGRREGVGVEATARIKIAGLSTIDRIRVSSWEPPNVLEIEHRGWVKGSGRIEVSDKDGGSRIFWRESFFPPMGLLGAAGLYLVKPLMRRIFERDLVLLRQLVESERPTERDQASR